jgi:hypothetical protein
VGSSMVLNTPAGQQETHGLVRSQHESAHVRAVPIAALWQLPCIGMSASCLLAGLKRPQVVAEGLCCGCCRSQHGCALCWVRLQHCNDCVHVFLPMVSCDCGTQRAWL